MARFYLMITFFIFKTILFLRILLSLVSCLLTEVLQRLIFVVEALNMQNDDRKLETLNSSSLLKNIENA